MPLFERENRYQVIKGADVKRYLNNDEISLLSVLIGKVDAGRYSDGRGFLNCVVVESDWPEYEPTWNAIECRVSGLKPCSVCGKPLPPWNASIEAKLDAGYPCPHATEMPQ